VPFPGSGRAGGGWLTDILRAPRNEFPEFPAALSFLMLLGPEGARAVLEQRMDALRTDLARLDAELTRHSGNLPRVTLLETEYQRAAVAAELEWVHAVVHDLETGTLRWSADDFQSATADVAQASVPERMPPAASS
jgi:hypothetical protein